MYLSKLWQIRFQYINGYVPTLQLIRLSCYKTIFQNGFLCHFIRKIKIIYVETDINVGGAGRIVY